MVLVAVFEVQWHGMSTASLETVSSLFLFDTVAHDNDQVAGRRGQLISISFDLSIFSCQRVLLISHD